MYRVNRDPFAFIHVAFHWVGFHNKHCIVDTIARANEKNVRSSNLQIWSCTKRNVLLLLCSYSFRRD